MEQNIVNKGDKVVGIWLGKSIAGTVTDIEFGTTSWFYTVELDNPILSCGKMRDAVMLKTSPTLWDEYAVDGGDVILNVDFASQKPLPLADGRQIILVLGHLMIVPTEGVIIPSVESDVNLELVRKELADRKQKRETK